MASPKTSVSVLDTVGAKFKLSASLILGYLLLLSTGIAGGFVI